MFAGRIQRSKQSQKGRSPSGKELRVILAEIVSMDPHFKNLPEITDHPGTFGILVSMYYDFGHTLILISDAEDLTFDYTTNLLLHCCNMGTILYLLHSYICI